MLTSAKMLPISLLTPMAARFHVRRRPQMKIGMLAVAFVFAGHLSLITYLPPCLERMSCVGQAVFRPSRPDDRFPASPDPVVCALVMAALAFGLVRFGATPVDHHTAGRPWGFGFGTVPDEAEIGGGVLVATMQVAITAGAALGHATAYASGIASAFEINALFLLTTWAVVTFSLKPNTLPGSSVSSAA